MILLIYLWKDGKDILNGIYIAFPLMYVILGFIYSDFKKELLFWTAPLRVDSIKKEVSLKMW